MKISCLCCTYLRPHLLAQSIECFLQQDYPIENRELVILDDAQQYSTMEHDGWRLISVPHRFKTLGEKRNACAALASMDVDAYAIWDDDDIYMPWALQSHAKALETGEWSRPSIYLTESEDGTLKRRKTNGLFHASWAFRRSVWAEVGGYRKINTGEDYDLSIRLQQHEVKEVDPCDFAEAFFVHRWETSNCWHLSAMGDTGYEELASRSPAERIKELRPSWPRDYRRARICE